MSTVETAVQYALAQVGKPYVWAQPRRSESQPQTISSNGYDCSGLTWAAYRSAGIKIGYVTYTQIKNGTSVSRENLQRGDLVFPDPGHVQIYLGNGQVVESPNRNSRVRVRSMYGFYAGRRIVGASTGGGGNAAPLPNPASISGAVDWLTDRSNWLRLYMILFGAVLIGAVAIPMVRSVTKEVGYG